MHAKLETSKFNRNSVKNTFIVALAVSLVCSILVSTTSVLLKPRQIENRLYYSGHRNIINLIESMRLGMSTNQVLQQLEVRLVDLESGEFFDEMDPEQYDQREAVKQPELNVEIPSELDVANISERARYAKVYLLREGSRINYFLLPVHGSGMWSTIYGYLALESDANTIASMSIYEHGETPGLGDKILNPEWLAGWQGKQLYLDGEVAFEVVKRQDPARSDYQVDAIAGATISSESVGRMLIYWFGQDAFQSFLAQFRQEQVE